MNYKEFNTIFVHYPESLQISEIGISLVALKKHLTKIASEEQERNWTNMGLTQFADILRNKNSLDLNKLADEILTNLVKYVNANQGALFILENSENSDKYLEMVSCYAYDRKKYLNKRIELNEGLVGQCTLEKETIIITKVPESYVNITSGLGDATPKCIIISPLIINEKVFGVLELASFDVFSTSKIEFINKVSESIASSIKNVKENARTLDLLNSSQIQAEVLRAQEEEMRQNLEEMQATQEEMTRRGNEQLSTMAEMDGIQKGINATMATIEFTIEGKIVAANENFLKTIKYTLQDIQGKHHKLFVPAHIRESDDYKSFWQDLASGKSKSGIFERIDSNGDSIWLNAIYNPIFNTNGTVSKIMKFATDITIEKNKEKEIQRLNESIELKISELKERENVFGLTSILSESDLYGNIIYANSKLVEVSGYSLEELINKPHNIFRHPDMPKELFKLMWHIIKSGNVFRGIIKNRAKDGSHYWVDGTFVPVKDAEGNLIKYIGARYHITDDFFAEKMYQKQMEDLKQGKRF